MNLQELLEISGVSQVWKGVCPSFVKHVILEDGGL